MPRPGWYLLEAVSIQGKQSSGGLSPAAGLNSAHARAGSFHLVKRGSDVKVHRMLGVGDVVLWNVRLIVITRPVTVMVLLVITGTGMSRSWRDILVGKESSLGSVVISAIYRGYDWSTQ